MEIYLVGGAVRDELLGRQVVEKDYLVVGATPAAMEKRGYRQVGKDFPVFIHPETGEEYALARTERKSGSGYYGFVCDFSPEITLEQDLQRRDLTINAMARDPDGRLHDPCGGRADLDARLLRHISPAFAEDPLRVLRVARFAARYAPLGFSIAPETLELMREIGDSGELDTLTPERIWKETERALGEATPAVYFTSLREAGALEKIFPELDRLWGVPNPEQWHPEIDSGIHTMMVLEQAAKLSDSTRVRFAAVCHDLGKGITPERHWPQHRGHEESGVPLIEAVCDRWRVPRDFRELAVLVSRFHLHMHKFFELKPTTILKVFNRIDAFRRPQRLHDFALACEADFRGRTGWEDRDYPQREALLACFAAAKNADTREPIERGLKGEAIRQGIDRIRAKAVAEARKPFMPE